LKKVAQATALFHLVPPDRYAALEFPHPFCGASPDFFLTKQTAFAARVRPSFLLFLWSNKSHTQSLV